MPLSGSGAAGRSGLIRHPGRLVDAGAATLFVNLGDHADNWDWLRAELGTPTEHLHTHFTWEDTQGFADEIRSESTEGIHVFLFDNTFHAVYATNYLMRVVDVMITKPSELAFYPIPKIFNERVGGHEAWGAIRSAELGDGTVETRSIPETLNAVDLIAGEQDLMQLYCDSIAKNKHIGIYDGAYRSVALATGTEWRRQPES